VKVQSKKKKRLQKNRIAEEKNTQIVVKGPSKTGKKMVQKKRVHERKKGPIVHARWKGSSKPFVTGRGESFGKKEQRKGGRRREKWEAAGPGSAPKVDPKEGEQSGEIYDSPTLRKTTLPKGSK